VLAVVHVPYVAAVGQILADPNTNPPVLAVAYRAGVVEVPGVAAIPGGLKAAILAFFGKKKTYEVLVTAMFALKQGPAEPADMFMQRVETVMHDLDVKMIDRTLHHNADHQTALAHYMARMSAVLFYNGIKPEIRQEVANDAITDHALILQKAINMEEAAASAKESKSQGGSQQQGACLVSSSGLVAKSGQCDYCGIFDHEARACKKRLADEKGNIFRP
jgi:hypothetical protein